MEQDPTRARLEPAGPAAAKPWRRWAALVVTFGGLVGGLVALHFVMRPAPLVQALISVPPERSAFFPTREVLPDRDSHQRNQMALAKSQLVINSALNDPKVANLPLIQNLNVLERVEWLEKEVNVDFTVAPEIMRVWMRGANVDDLKVLVDAVCEAYKREILHRQNVQRRTRLTVLEELVRKYEAQLRQARQDGEDAGDKSAGRKAVQTELLRQDLFDTRRELRRVQLEKGALAARAGKEKAGRATEADALDAQERFLAAEVARLTDALVDAAKERPGPGAREDEIGHLQDTLRQLKREHEAIKIQLEAPSNVQVIQPAAVHPGRG